jgi:hypothetical protein
MQIHSYCTKRAYFDSVIKQFYDFYASTHSLAYLQFLALSLPPSQSGSPPILRVKPKPSIIPHEREGQHVHVVSIIATKCRWADRW